MRTSTSLAGLIAAGALATLPAVADVSSRDLAADTQWYIHVDFEAMRDSSVAKELNRWMESEVYDGIDSELGVDVSAELDRFIAYGNEDGDFTVRLGDGISAATQKKLLREIEDDTEVRRETGSFGEYFVIDGDEHFSIEGDNDVDIKTDTVYVSLDRQIVVTSSLDRLEDAMTGRRGGGASVLILDGSKPFVQIGANTGFMQEEGEVDFDSDLLQKTEQVAILIGDSNGLIDLHTRITASDPQVTNSLANIVRGLIGLQTLSSELPPYVTDILQSLRVDADSAGLSLRLTVAADSLRQLLDED